MRGGVCFAGITLCAVLKVLQSLGALGDVRDLRGESGAMKLGALDSSRGLGARA